MEKKFSIHEVAELLGISTDAIRLYERSGLVTPLRNEKNGYRYYKEVQWDFKELFSYAEKHGYQCTGELFVFYVYSLICDEQKVDYYEIYVPLL